MRFKERHWLAFTLLAWVALIGPGKIEGKYFPAAAPMVLTNFWPGSFSDPVSGREISLMKIWGQSARLRPECYFRRIEWFLGQRDQNHVPVHTTLGRSIVRPDGVFRFGPWFILVETSSALLQHSFSDVLHRCYYFGMPAPWLTRSRFWR